MNQRAEGPDSRMRHAGAYRRQLVAQGPRGEMPLDAYALRMAWKYSAYGDGGGPFPGVRRAARRMLSGTVVRLIVALIVAAWVLLVSRVALMVRAPAPAYEAPRPRLPDLASARMTTGPPATVAAPEAPVISP
jgi:hypothetical protein